MGYTHTYSRVASCEVNGKLVPNRALSRLAFKSFAEEVSHAARVSQVHLAGWDGQATLPEFSEKQVEFNGQGENGLETFRITRRKSSNSWPSFTKTGRRPYDVVVVATLCLLKDHFPAHFSIRTDGAVDDWEAGYRLAVTASGRPLSLASLFPFEDKYPEQNKMALALEEEVCAPLRLAQRRIEAAMLKTVESENTPRRRRIRP